MILDQTIGVHHAQVEYLTLGWMQTWVSGDSPAATIILGPYRFSAADYHTAGIDLADYHTAGTEAAGSI